MNQLGIVAGRRGVSKNLTHIIALQLMSREPFVSCIVIMYFVFV